MKDLVEVLAAPLAGIALSIALYSVGANLRTGLACFGQGHYSRAPPLTECLEHMTLKKCGAQFLLIFLEVNCCRFILKSVVL